MYLEGVAILPQLHLFQKNRVCDGERSDRIDGRDRIVHVALRLQSLRVQIARLLLLDEQLDRAERVLWVHQQTLCRPCNHRLANHATCPHGQLCFLLSPIVGVVVDSKVQSHLRCSYGVTYKS